MEDRVIGVRFTSTGKLYYFNLKNYLLNIGDQVVAESERGQELGRVVIKLDKKELKDASQKVENIIRVATKQDILDNKELKKRANDAIDVCKEQIKKLKLEMKLVTASYTLDESKLIFYFTAEDRVDFRELVKYLASEFKTRIELRQIGPRDEVKEHKMLGVCGRELCCRTFLPEFETVTIKTVKEQGLQINMQKLSGCCGKLKCCIKYEEDVYKEKLKGLPKLNEIVEFSSEKAKVVGQDILAQKVKLKIGQPGEERFVIADVSEIKRISNNNVKEGRGE